MFEILTLNPISPVGLERLPAGRYRITDDVARPDAILLRSFDMHGFCVADSVKAVARAGAGVNNIPYEELARRGIPVFNAPGANANAVKELTVAGMLLAARNIRAALEFARSLDGDHEALVAQVEEGKRRFVGFELPGRTLGVIGLGAVGVLVANAALELGMRVVGYDPDITVRRAWQLDSEVRQAASVADLLARADMVTLHVPLNEHTRHLIGARGLGMMPDGATVLNFSRDEIVDEEAIIAALDSRKLHAYVCDFPSRRLLDHPRVIALPHIGASTREAEDNCAIMVADQIREYLEDGNIRHAVNFPEVEIPRNEGYRVSVVNANVPNMLGQISTALAQAGLNILDMLNRSRGEIAYTLADVEDPVPEDVIASIAAVEGVMSVRALGCAVETS